MEWKKSPFRRKRGRRWKTTQSLVNDQILADLAIFNWTHISGKVMIDKVRFANVYDMIRYYMQEKKPVTESIGAILKAPVPRQDWELKHESVSHHHDNVARREVRIRSWSVYQSSHLHIVRLLFLLSSYLSPSCSLCPLPGRFRRGQPQHKRVSMPW